MLFRGLGLPLGGKQTTVLNLAEPMFQKITKENINVTCQEIDLRVQLSSGEARRTEGEREYSTLEWGGVGWSGAGALLCQQKRPGQVP